MSNYKMDMGVGISRSFSDVFFSLSICFKLICILAGIINWYLKKKNIPADIWKGLLLIETIISGVLFLVMLKFTFLPPIVCTDAISFFLLGAYFVTEPAKAEYNLHSKLITPAKPRK